MKCKEFTKNLMGGVHLKGTKTLWENQTHHDRR
jgi:hypothetical protein